MWPAAKSADAGERSGADAGGEHANVAALV